MWIPLDQDVFSRILSHVPDSKTIYAILLALPKSHFLFPVALQRLCELPIYLDTDDPRAAAASNSVLDYLLGAGADANHLRIAESIRHLVVSVEHNKYYWPPTPEVPEEEEEEEEEEDEQVENTEETEASLEEDTGEDGDEPEENVGEDDEESESEEDVDVTAFHERLPDLFTKTRNLESLDYHNFPGLGMLRAHMVPLAAHEGLRTFGVDSTIRPTSWRGLEAFADPELWDIEPFLLTLGPMVTSLDLRHVCRTMLTALLLHGDTLASYYALKHLKMDITEGVWDWNGMGSPQRGASSDYVFPPLRLPSVRRFELVVSDLTISNPRAGPLDLVDCTLLTELSLDIRQCIGYMAISTVKLFEALSPSNFSAISHLEIKDNTWNVPKICWDDTTNSGGWKQQGRYFFGLVRSFLGSILTGSLAIWSASGSTRRRFSRGSPAGSSGTTRMNSAPCRHYGMKSQPSSMAQIRAFGGRRSMGRLRN
ncbi:hypothetical protein B0H10DRAFT_916565 [Mycena sp. CBHHK59/15]|nr:hypothetical protein B0H10DRAFT_916565 [Mycena sp. CBHHK59/15]